MTAMTKEQLLKPKRAVHPVQLAEYDAPVLLGTPSGMLTMRLRAMRQRGVDLDSREALQDMVVDMMVDADGNRLLTSEDAGRFIEGLSIQSITSLVTKFAELAAPAKDDAAVPSEPSTSAS